MTTRPFNILRDAFSLLSIRFVLQQLGLALAACLLALAWLRIPDASVFAVIASVVVGLALIAVAGTAQSALLLRLCGVERSWRKLALGSFFLLLALALWFGWSVLLHRLQANDSLRAGYLNSRFPHSLRNVFSFAHLLTWFGWMWTALLWMGAGILAIFVVHATASSRPAHTMLCSLRSLTYWLVIVFGGTGAAIFTSAMLAWTPGHGLRVETLSLVLRLATVCVVDVFVASLLLATLATCIRSLASTSKAL
jgi:hypothetical protein